MYIRLKIQGDRECKTVNNEDEKNIVVFFFLLRKQRNIILPLLSVDIN